LGKAFKKLRKLQKGSKKMKALSDKMHKAAKKAMDKLGIPPNLQNKVHKKICTVTGHPVDVASGKVFTERLDFVLPGAIPLKWKSVWYSTSVYRGPLGVGWHHAYDMAAWLEDETVVIRGAEGLPLVVPARSDTWTHFRTMSLRARRTAQAVQVQDGRGLMYTLTPIHGHDPHHFRLVSISDEVGHRVEFSYDGRGRLGEIRDTAGRIIGLEYDLRDLLMAITGPDPNGAGARVVLVQHEYNDEGMLVRATDAVGAAMHYTYEQELLVGETNRDGVSFYFSYDRLGHDARCVRTWGDGGIFDHHLQYDPVAGITAVTNSLGAVTRYHHDGAVVHRVIDALGVERVTAYDEDYLIIERVDGTGRTTTYEYDDAGRPTLVQHPDGSTVVLRYGSHSNPVDLTDRAGGRWSWQYDEFNRPVERQDPTGATTRYEYAGAELTAVIFPDGGRMEFGRDGSGNIAWMKRASGAIERWRYDALGRAVEEVSASGAKETRTYDLRGRLVGVIGEDGNPRRLQYSGEGHVLSASDQHSHLTMTYTGLGQVASRREGDRTISFDYDTEDRLIGIVNELGRRYRLERGPTGEVEQEIDFEGNRRTFERDAEGRPVRIGHPSGAWTERKYDDAGRLAAVIHSDGTKRVYRYRHDGALIEAGTERGTLHLERDALGRVLREVQGDDWVEQQLSAQGIPEKISSSLGAALEAVLREDGSMLSLSDEVGDYSIQFERDELGREVERNVPGSLSLRSQYSGGRTSRQHAESPSGPIVDRTYTWQLGRQLIRTEDFEETTEYAYDVGGAAVAARGPNGLKRVRMADAAGRLHRHMDLSDRKHGGNGQLLQAVTTEGVTRSRYDTDGRLIERYTPGGDVWRYRWDGEGMLRAVERPDGSMVEFTYDALGRRLSKTINGRTKRWLWLGHTPLHEWTTGGDESHDDVVTWVFDALTSAPIARLSPAGNASIVSDDAGRPIVAVDERGEPVWRARADLWRGVIPEEGALEICPFRFPGQYEDEETGLYYNRFRYYDPDAGQYISPDPLRLIGGLNLYAYARDPHRYADVLGLNPSDIALGLANKPIYGPDGKKAGIQPGVLDDFAKDPVGDGSVKASTWTDFDQVVDDNGLTDFEKTIKGGMDDAEKIHFNVEGMSEPDWKDIAKNPDPSKFHPPSTNWELATCMSDDDLRKKTQLYDGKGNPIDKPPKCG
jgi:RHS repeat-associated protein